MNQQQRLILVKGEDKTSEIHSYAIKNSYVYITYKSNKSRTYRFRADDVVIKPFSENISFENKAIYKDNIPLYGVTKAFHFDGIGKVHFANGGSEIFDYRASRLQDQDMEREKSVRDILSYWREVATYANTDDEKGSFLKKQMDNMNVIHSDSVLHNYLYQVPIKHTGPSSKNVIFPFPFNASQKEALSNALSSNISVIEGPPGTGKTQTILNIIANLSIMQGKSVAIVASNNAAVKNVQDKMENENYHFLLAALGKKDNIDIFFKHIPHYDVANWKSEKSEEELLTKINDINKLVDDLLEKKNEEAKIQQELSAYLLEQQHFERYYEEQKIEKIENLSFYRKSPDRIISFLIDHHFAKDKGILNKLIYKSKLFVKHGFIHFKKLKEKEIEIILNFQRKYYEYKIAELRKRKREIEEELEKRSFESLLEEHRTYSSALFKHKLYKKYSTLRPFGLERKTYKYSTNFKQFIEHFPIVLSTTHSLRNCIAANFLFDYLIIDEASQVDLVSAALALSCCKNVIIVGDTKQLPHIVNQNIKYNVNDDGIAPPYNYSQHNILTSMLSLYGSQLPRTILKEHYRCHPQIIDFCNQKYYNGELIPFTKEREGDEPLFLYRTAKGNHMRKVVHGKKGRYNQRELDVTVEEILNNPALNIEKYSDVGFTTPYRKQVDKATDVLHSDIEADTVHKYQGREKPIIIMSTVLDNSYVGRKGIEFVDDPRIINVAVSRAQEKFILVTDHGLFNKLGKEVSDLIRYMEYNTLDDHIIYSEIVSVFDLLYKQYSSKLIALKSRMQHISKYKSENILYQLLSDILQDEPYHHLNFTHQVYLKNLLNHTRHLNGEEERYVKHNSSVDFVVYYKLNKKPLLVVEVDGFSYHENNPEQLKRDKLKNDILEKYSLPIIRLPTNGSGEEKKLRIKLDELIGHTK